MNPEMSASAAAILQLDDDEFFSLSEQRRMDLADALAEVGENATPPGSPVPPLLAIGAPRQANVASQGKVPILLGSFETVLRGWQVNLQPNLHLFVKQLSTGDMLSSTPLTSVRRGLEPLPSGVGSPPQGSKAAATRAAVQSINLLDRMGEQMIDGELVVTAVSYDSRSNTVRTRVAHPRVAGVPELETQSYVRSALDLRPQIEPEILVPGEGSIASGIQIRVATQVAAQDGLLRNELNQPFLPCHVILLQLDNPAVILKASPPVQQVARPDGQQAFNALFMVELGGERGQRVRTGSYMVYLDIGAGFHGPFPMKVAD